MSHDRRRAVLRVKNVPLVDTKFYAGVDLLPSTANIYARWYATDKPKKLGKGLKVDPIDPAAFRGKYAPARSVGWFSGNELGFSFKSKHRATSDLGYAAIGKQRNGEFL